MRLAKPDTQVTHGRLIRSGEEAGQTGDGRKTDVEHELLHPWSEAGGSRGKVGTNRGFMVKGAAALKIVMNSIGPDVPAPGALPPP
ncbi:hypothetical protein, partial [Variovorax sp. UMC13]|uniref:hypothetical protein n=1 Tax=Variovorax sp. UMC13 TaxID=1862326 RepID=UPI001C7FE944